MPRLTAVFSVLIILLLPHTGYTKIFGSPNQICDMFAAPNNLYLEDDYYRSLSDMTEERFNEIIDSVVTYYTPLAQARGASLIVERNWQNPEVNAYASRPSATEWVLSMFGGLARRPEVTDDGFALVVCHELGHQFGGYPFARLDWAANEGQSDFFATQACARNIWKSQVNRNKTFASSVSPSIRAYCDQAWVQDNDKNLCYRIGEASQSLGNLLAKLRNTDDPNVETPDPAIVEATESTHPDPQCRLDTYMNGGTCTINFNDNIIPGLVNGSGTMDRLAEIEAGKQSCMSTAGFEIGTRPRCWFAPLLGLKLQDKQVEYIQVEGNSNNIIEPGETYNINIPVLNTFLNTVPSASAKLTVRESGIVVSAPFAQYKNLKTDVKTTPVELSQFKIPVDYKCGNNITLDYRLRGNSSTDSKTLRVTTGIPVVLNEIPSNFEPRDIPDNDEAGVDEYLSQNAAEEIIMVEVYVNISHEYVSDLRIAVYEPNGYEHVIKKKYDNSMNSLEKVYKIIPTSANTSGEWRINVSDRARSDLGKFNSWSMKFHKAKCEQ